MKSISIYYTSNWYRKIDLDKSIKESDIVWQQHLVNACNNLRSFTMHYNSLLLNYIYEMWSGLDHNIKILQ